MDRHLKAEPLFKSKTRAIPCDAGEDILSHTGEIHKK